MDKQCLHMVVQWMGWEGGWYRLQCAQCGEYLGEEAFLPNETAPFAFNNVTDYTVCNTSIVERAHVTYR